MSDESPVQAMIRQEQLWRLRDAKCYAERLIKLGEELIKKIDRDGYAGYYSVNHDSLAAAQKLHTACNDLWRLRVLSEKLDKVSEDASIAVSHTPEPEVQKAPKQKSKRRKKKD